MVADPGIVMQDTLASLNQSTTETATDTSVTRVNCSFDTGGPAASGAAIPATPLHELTGFYLAVDCLAPDGQASIE